MITRFGSGWQTITADLALILFLITAQVAAQKPVVSEAKDQASDTADTADTADRTVAGGGKNLPMPVAALAIHKPAQGEAIDGWLDEVVDDERKLVTIAVGFSPSGQTEAVAEGNRLLSDAIAAGVKARLVLEPASRNDIVLSVDYLDGSVDGTEFAQDL